MAASVNVFGPIGAVSFERRDPYTRLVKAMAGDQYELRRLQRAVSPAREAADVFFRATTDTNTAAGEANVALNLSTALGLTVASGAIASNERRDIIVACRVVDAANGRRYAWEQRTTVGVSASELVIVGKNPQFLTDCRATCVFASADGAATTESAAECFPPAWWDGASPAASAISSNTFTISWLGGTAPIGGFIAGSVESSDASPAAADARSYQHGNVSLSNGTSSVFISDVASPTAATVTNNSAAAVSAIVLPPMSAVLGIGTTPAPDQLILSLVGVASVALIWDVGVTIGDPYLIS